MFPDIAIANRRTRKICCVVEIGYTRPEKLAAYRLQLKIPDVRWYDKAGNLHNKEIDRETKIITKRVVFEPDGDFSAYVIDDSVPCFSESCEEEAGDADDDEAWLYLQTSVMSVLITDWHYAWLPSFCDKCGEHFMPSCSEEAVLLIADLEGLSPSRFGMTYGRRALHAGWSDCINFAKKHLFWHGEASIEYLEGIPIGNAPDLRRSAAISVDFVDREHGQ